MRCWRWLFSNKIPISLGVDFWAGDDFGQVDADRKEVTLDDLWSLDLAKLAEYKEVRVPLSIHIDKDR